MSSEPPPLPPQKPLTAAVIAAFVPSILALLIGTLNPAKSVLVPVCIVAALVSIGCCIYSSVALLGRNSLGPLVFGILLGMVNVLVSAGLGCAAILSDFNVR